ncbi:MAG: hypothetical protein BHV77_00110 [Bacteroides sp. 43_108]|nr:MAG: hypothetical protein BHV77_00110 [Bacteroides sp. 43_108]
MEYSEYLKAGWTHFSFHSLISAQKAGGVSFQQASYNLQQPRTHMRSMEHCGYAANRLETIINQ